MAEARGVSGAFDGARLNAILDALKGGVGFLALGDGEREVCLLFAKEAVRVVANGHRLPRLGPWLALRGIIDAAQQARLEELTTVHRLDERAALQRLEALPADALDRAARALLVSVVLDALFWRDPACDAATGEPPFQERLYQADHDLLHLPCEVDLLLAELDDKVLEAVNVARIVPGVGVSVTTTSEEAARERLERCAGTFEGDLIEAILARPGIHGTALLKALRCGEMALLSLLARLSSQGVVRVDPLPVDPAGDRERRGRLERRLRSASSRLVQLLCLAETSRGQGDLAAATRHLAQAGWILVGSKRHEEALELFNAALRDDPKDLEALAGRVEALWGLSRREEAASAAERVARRYLDVRLPGQARRLLERALEARESGGLLALLVEALEQLGERRKAQELQHSVVLQLRQEGREKEAAQLERRLAEGGARSTGRTERPSGPSLDDRWSTGGARVAALVSLLVCPLLGGLAWLSWQEVVGRRAYAQAADRVEAALREGRDPLALEPARLLPEGAFPGSAAERAARARQALEELQADARGLPRLREVLSYEHEDLDLVLGFLKEARSEARSDALRRPLDAAVARLEAERRRIVDEVATLERMVRRHDMDRAFALAKELTGPGRRRVGDVMSGLRVPIRIDSEPSGAAVIWQGIALGRRTPITVDVPLRGAYDLRLELAGRAPLEATIELATLEDPRPVFVLEPVGGAEGPR